MIQIDTPAIWYPGQDDLEFEEELEAMLFRANATSDFLNGNLDADGFLDFLNQQGYDVFDLAENCWNLVL